MINSKDVSVVIQGPTSDYYSIFKICKSIRKYLPDAELIFSTWHDSKHEWLDFLADEVVCNDDPQVEQTPSGLNNSVNRILISTNAGLEVATRKYCLKMRSDLILENNKILSILDKFPKRDDRYSVFENRVVFYNLFTRVKGYFNACGQIECPLQLSDWLCFGLTSDINKYFANAKLTHQKEFANYLSEDKAISISYRPKGEIWKFPPEQYFAQEFFTKYFPQMERDNYLSYTPEQVKLSRLLFVNNIIPCGFNEIGIYSLKKVYSKLSKHINKIFITSSFGLYSYEKFLYDYKKYCDDSYKIPLKNKIKHSLSEFRFKLFMFRKNLIKLRFSKKEKYLFIFGKKII